MKIADAMVVWTPDRDLYTRHPKRGMIAVTTIPEPAHLRMHAMSAGACDLGWKMTDHDGRRKLLQKLFTTIIHQDGIPEGAVREAFSIIDDVDATSLNPAPPAK